MSFDSLFLSPLLLLSPLLSLCLFASISLRCATHMYLISFVSLALLQLYSFSHSLHLSFFISFLLPFFHLPLHFLPSSLSSFPSLFNRAMPRFFRKSQRYNVAKNSWLARIVLLDNTTIDINLQPDVTGADCLE